MSEQNPEPEDKYTVLYIEDNVANVRLVSSLMSRRPNIHLLTALEPIQGLKLAMEHKPDLILLDINLPGMSGFEVLQELRQHDSTKHIPAIAVSAYAFEKDIQQGLDAGFVDYISKPFDLKLLLQTIANY